MLYEDEAKETKVDEFERLIVLPGCTKDVGSGVLPR
jgi:hypothetical protein